MFVGTKKRTIGFACETKGKTHFRETARKDTMNELPIETASGYNETFTADNLVNYIP